MKKLYAVLGLGFIGLILWAFSPDSPQKEQDYSAIKWLTFEEAVTKNKVEQRMFFIDVYTDWCGWCKVMDKRTFSNEIIAAYVNSSYYPVKLDAEQMADIKYDGKVYKHVGPAGRGGYHELAATLLNGQLSFPTVVFFSKEEGLLSPVPGYQKPRDLHRILVFFAENEYKTKSFEDFLATSYKSPF